jgi:hypothetical protein
MSTRRMTPPTASTPATVLRSRESQVRRQSGSSSTPQSEAPARAGTHTNRSSGGHPPRAVHASRGDSARHANHPPRGSTTASYRPIAPRPSAPTGQSMTSSAAYREHQAMPPPPDMPPLALGRPYAAAAGDCAYFAGRLPEALRIWSTSEAASVHFTAREMGIPVDQSVRSALNVVHRAYQISDLNQLQEALDAAFLCAPRCFIIPYQLGFVILARSKAMPQAQAVTNEMLEASKVFDCAVRLIKNWELQNPEVGETFSQSMSHYLRHYVHKREYARGTVASAIAAWQQNGVLISARASR